jgi:hypothetical protein
MARGANKQSTDYKELVDEYKDLVKTVDEEAKAFIKPLLQQAVTEQVARANLEIEHMKAMVENLGQASSYLIQKLAEVAKFNQDTAVAQRIRRTKLADFENLDHCLHTVLRDVELYPPQERVRRREA